MSNEGGRPPARSPEFAPYFEMVVTTSTTREEAVSKLGYAGASLIYRYSKRFGVELPAQWTKRPNLGRQNQRGIPDTIIPTTDGRAWVGGLVQGEGSIKCHYVRPTDTTTLDISTGMTDPVPIFKLSEYYGLSRPAKPRAHKDWNPVWNKNVGGLRALRVLREILPFLVGEKLREAEKALEFFSPYGCRRGHYRAGDIWPPDKFALRKRAVHTGVRDFESHGKNGVG